MNNAASLVSMNLGNPTQSSESSWVVQGFDESEKSTFSI
jgi:hypothetical protein